MKAIQKKLKSTAGLRAQTRALEQVEYLIKNGTMRIVHEMNDEKHQIRSAKNQFMDPASEDYDYTLHEVVKQKCENILKLLANPDEQKNARKESQALRDRVRGEEYKGGTKQQYSGFDNSSYNKNKYDIEAGSNRKQYGNNNDDFFRYNRDTGAKYDDGGSKKGESDLYKKQGIKNPEENSTNKSSSPKKEGNAEKKDEKKPTEKRTLGLPPPPDPKINNSLGLSKGLPKPPTKGGPNQTDDFDDLLGGTQTQTKNETVTQVKAPEPVNVAPVQRGLPKPPSYGESQSQVQAKNIEAKQSPAPMQNSIDIFGDDFAPQPTNQTVSQPVQPVNMQQNTQPTTAQQPQQSMGMQGGFGNVFGDNMGIQNTNMGMQQGNMSTAMNNNSGMGQNLNMQGGFGTQQQTNTYMNIDMNMGMNTGMNTGMNQAGVNFMDIL